MSQNLLPIKRALLSVSDKEQLIPLARLLELNGVEIISTGGTFRHLKEQGINAVEIKDYTGEVEVFGGRLKTLGRPIMGGLLFHRERDEVEAQNQGIRPIDLVVCNLYPFHSLPANCSADEMIELIDIGGPCMLRAAAKNFESVTVLSSPGQYSVFMQHFQAHKNTNIHLRRQWANAAFVLTASYDSMIAQKMGAHEQKEISPLRYGENPHQKAWIEFQESLDGDTGVTILQGKEMSFNNYTDLAQAIRTTELLANEAAFAKKSIVSIIKHQNPCGVSSGPNQQQTLLAAWDADPVSAFGGIVCFNQTVLESSALYLAEHFVEVVAAPDFSREALTIFAKKKNLRLATYRREHYLHQLEKRQLTGKATLVQERDQKLALEWQWMTQMRPGNLDREAMMFAEHVGRMMKSNAIAIVQRVDGELTTVGLGMGNPNRLLSMKVALEEAKKKSYFNPAEAWLYSDAFFPFADGIELAHAFGIKKILQPGGSINDQKVIDKCNQYNICMAFSNIRHFWH